MGRHDCCYTRDPAADKPGGPRRHLAPLDYTTLVWALLWGWLLWKEWPSAATLLGACVVVLAGLYVIFREARAGRAEPRPQPR